MMAITDVSTRLCCSPFDEGVLALSQIRSKFIVAQIKRTEVFPDTVNGRLAVYRKVYSRYNG